jgi:hypothetical protein
MAGGFDFAGHVRAVFVQYRTLLRQFQPPGAAPNELGAEGAFQLLQVAAYVRARYAMAHRGLAQRAGVDDGDE